MTLDDAIRVSTYLSNEPKGVLTHGQVTALKLGIQALKRLKDMRAGKITIISIPLKGETKD